MKRFYKIFLTLFIVAMVTPIFSLNLYAQDKAQSEELIGTYKAWTAYRYEMADGVICTMWSKPDKSEGDYTRRGDVWAFVTHRPDAKRFGELVMQMGYPLANDKEVSLTIDGKQKFNYFAEGESAFASMADSDKIIKAFRNGTKLIVEGVSSRGTKTKDSFSLAGFTAAYAAINKSCPQ